MSTVTDSQNFISSKDSAPDKLRAEIGTYYSEVSIGLIGPDGIVTPTEASTYLFKGYNEGIKSSYIETEETNQQTLMPTKKAKIFLSGRDSEFRDQIQWNDYVKKNIFTQVAYLDHQFDLHDFSPRPGLIVKNFHNPTYEDFTKSYPSNQLLNYNLISYPYKDRSENVSRIGDIRTRFDNRNYVAGVTNSIQELMSQYANRVSNYTGSVEELSVKQRNIFDLQRTQYSIQGNRLVADKDTERSVEPTKFPFYFQKDLENRLSNNGFNKVLSQYGKRKQLLQSIKQDLSFSNKNFRIQLDDVSAKLYNLINLMTSTRIVQFEEQSDEIFLLPEMEITNANQSDRFLNSVNAVRFLSEMRRFIDSNSRSYEEIVGSTNSKSFFIGYKIEKYLDNDATQPIQTYYTNDRRFIDTQLKYGRKYIYKTKVLIAILGSTYSYKNLHISSQDGEMINEQGDAASRLPSGFGSISSDKYQAYVDVHVSPSFQVLEYQIDEDVVSFVDLAPSAPQVYFYNQPHKPQVEFFFSPMYEDMEGIDDNIRMQYFSGIYEIYRLDQPPKAMEEFEDGFLTTIDEQTTLTSLNPSWDELPDYSKENMNGHYADGIIQNQKYYYAFKAVSYHGSKSKFTKVFEVEMLKDSDEYKVMVREYAIPVEINHTYTSSAKRIMKITPNIERLLFSEEESLLNWKLDDGNMLTRGQTTKFKIRITSKHTGKKIDLNLNLKLDDRT